MILKNFQACCLQFQLYMMMRKMYCMMLSNYLQLFRLKYIIEQIIVEYIIEQIYVHKKLTPICSKLIFRRMLIKLATKCTFTFIGRFFKQVDKWMVAQWEDQYPLVLAYMVKQYCNTICSYTINAIQSMAIFIIQKEYHQTLMMKSL